MADSKVKAPSLRRVRAEGTGRKSIEGRWPLSTGSCDKTLTRVSRGSNVSPCEVDALARHKLGDNGHVT